MVVGILVVVILAASGFVPVSALPGGLQGFIKYQPFTQMVDAVRSMLASGTVHVSGAAWASLAWGAGLLLVLGAVALHRHRVLT